MSTTNTISTSMRRMIHPASHIHTRTDMSATATHTPPTCIVSTGVEARIVSWHMDWLVGEHAAAMSLGKEWRPLTGARCSSWAHGASREREQLKCSPELQHSNDGEDDASKPRIVDRIPKSLHLEFRVMQHRKFAVPVHFREPKYYLARALVSSSLKKFLLACAPCVGRCVGSLTCSRESWLRPYLSLSLRAC
jgi:hypothetical protein